MLASRRILSYFIIVLLFVCVILASESTTNNTWVVIVNTSRYWFNYRHAANAVIVYQLVKTLGISEDKIILMNAFDIANDIRNPSPGTVHYTGAYGMEVWPYDEMIVDYTDNEVSVESFISLLTGRPRAELYGKAQLKSNQNSSILIYMAGHGGDEFFKFHDNQELSAQNLALTFEEMHIKGRYKDILFILDTCQASTMSNYITSPHIATLASSAKGENSYAYNTDESLGVAIVDRFTHSMSEYFRSIMKYIPNADIGNGQRKAQIRSDHTLHDLHRSFNTERLHSTATLILSPGTKDPKHIRLNRFFGGFKQSQTNSKAAKAVAATAKSKSFSVPMNVSQVTATYKEEYVKKMLNIS